MCFAVKSNGNLSILNGLAKLGSGFDIVSGGELDHFGHLGVRGDRIVFSGVGKTREEIRAALKYSGAAQVERSSRGRSGILLFNVESEAELEILLEESERQVWRGGEEAPSVAIRVNPDVRRAGIRIFRPAAILTSSASIGRRRGGSILRIEIPSISGGRESARTSVRRLFRSSRSARRFAALPGLSANCSVLGFSCSIWISAADSACATRPRKSLRAGSMRGCLRALFDRWGCTFCLSPDDRSLRRRVCC